MQGEEFNIQANGVEIHGVRMGQGEPLLLLHGHPETCLMWHKVAPQLAERFTVVATDLRGYGDSGKPEGLPDHSNYSKRTMAEDQIEVMRALGFERFHVMGHDRGARVAYRMALDHPEAVNKLVLLDIVSTYDMYSLSTREFAKALLLHFARLSRTYMDRNFWRRPQPDRAFTGKCRSAFHSLRKYSQ